jgi:hypothetical protein
MACRRSGVRFPSAPPVPRSLRSLLTGVAAGNGPRASAPRASALAARFPSRVSHGPLDARDALPPVGVAQHIPRSAAEHAAERSGARGGAQRSTRRCPAHSAERSGARAALRLRCGSVQGQQSSATRGSRIGDAARRRALRGWGTRAERGEGARAAEGPFSNLSNPAAWPGSTSSSRWCRRRCGGGAGRARRGRCRSPRCSPSRRGTGGTCPPRRGPRRRPGSSPC